MAITIVALPAVDDKVHRISSEKIPHLTLCVLGETDASETIKIVEFAQHAASQLSPFGLSVQRRGTLGLDNADVVFFEKKYSNYERIEDYRGYLLKNDAIQLAYNKVDQFPEWTPHLTLGYPDAPAKPDDSDYPGIHYVNFDRIAVWVDEFSGPEFQLEYEESGADVLSMSDLDGDTLLDVVKNHLKHYGKKGMRWGVTTVDKASQPTVTRDTPAKKKAVDVEVSQKKAGTYVKSKGGQRQKATDDAVKAQAGRQKARKSTTDSLTNDELQATINRMQLESQFHKLNKQTNRQKIGREFVEALMGLNAANNKSKKK